MKSPLLLLLLPALLAGTALCQLQGVPQCGVTCIVGAVLNSTCGVTDMPCICADVTLQTQAQECVKASCTIREQLTTLNITNTQCGVASPVDHSWVPPLVFFIIFGGIVFVLRLVSRLVAHAKFWWDDFFNLLAFLATLAFSIVSIISANLGVGTNIWSVPQDNITTLLTLSYVDFIVYELSEVTLRTSILLFYIRIFTFGTGPRRIFWAVLSITNIISVGFLFYNIFQCWPIAHFWLQWDGQHQGRCNNPNTVALSGAIIDLVEAVVIMAIPFPYIFRLRLPPSKKFAVSVMFAWGLCTIIIMGIRFKVLDAFSIGQNTTVDGIGLYLWSGLELDVGLVCACLPSVYPLFARLISRGKPKAAPAPNAESSVATIGGSGGKLTDKLRRIRQSSLYPTISMTGLTVTGSREDDQEVTKPGEFLEMHSAPFSA